MTRTWTPNSHITIEWEPGHPFECYRVFGEKGTEYVFWGLSVTFWKVDK